LNRKFFITALSALTTLFVLRVSSQFIQSVAPVSWLPEFSRWQGSTTPYWQLFAIQLTIIVIMTRTIAAHRNWTVVRTPGKGKWLIGLGAVYFVSMAIRLVVGLGGFSSLPWFQKTIPALFHLVLASFVLLTGAYHMRWVADDDIPGNSPKEGA
jgi:hypothetical protein